MARPRKTVATAKSAAAKAEKAAEVKAAEKAAEVKPAEEIKKTPAKKTTTRKPACKVSTCVELNGLSVSVSNIEVAVKKAVKASGAEAADVKIYINAAEQAAYYTVDGAGDATNKVDLKAL